MRNPIYHFISENLQEFTKSISIEKKQAATSKKDYFYIALPSTPATTLAIGEHAYNVITYHISVYEDLREEQQYQNASYHITACLFDDKKDAGATARIYFTAKNIFFKVICKDAKDELLEVNTASYMQFGYSTIKNFSGALNRISAGISQTYAEKYSTQLVELEETSKLIHQQKNTNNLSHFTSYQEKINQMQTLLHEWQARIITPRPVLMVSYERLSAAVARKIKMAELQARSKQPSSDQKSEAIEISADVPSDQTQVVQQPQHLILRENIRALNDAKLTNDEKIILEYSYRSSLFEISPDDDEILDCIIINKKLEDNAKKSLLHKAIKKEEKSEQCKALALISKPFQYNELTLVVKNNQPAIMEVILQTQPYLTPLLNEMKEQKGLLELAYEKKMVQMMRVLIHYGAYCDLITSSGARLLRRAVDEQSQEAIVILLQAGADALSTDFLGYTPIAYLAMCKNKRPSVAIVRAFLENSPGELLVNLMQGSYQTKSTLLCWACQENWDDIAEVLFEFGANPAAMRESDLLNCVEITAGKGHTKTLDMIIKHSKHPFTGLLFRAMQIAGSQNKHEMQKYIRDYMEKNNIPLTHDGYSLMIPPGSSGNTITRVLNFASTGRNTAPQQPALLGGNTDIVSLLTSFSNLRLASIQRPVSTPPPPEGKQKSLTQK